MPELTQQQFETLQVEAHDAKQRFLQTLARAPEAQVAYEQWMRAERQAWEGGRALRASEVHGG